MNVRVKSLMSLVVLPLFWLSCSNVVYHWNWNNDKVGDVDWSRGTCIVVRPNLPQGVEFNSQLKETIVKESKLIWNDSVIYIDSIISWHDIDKNIEAKYLLQLSARGNWEDSGGFGYGNTTFPTGDNEIYFYTSVLDFESGERIYNSTIRADDAHGDLDYSTEKGNWYTTKSADYVVKRGFIKGIRNLQRSMGKQ